MNKFIEKIFFFTVFLVLLSCENNFKNDHKIIFSEFTPNNEADFINLKYTDSGRITAILISPKMLDFYSVNFPYTEFPKGIDITVYDKQGKRTFVKSNYAISYKLTGIINLKGNVKIITEKGEMLKTEQLYFDQKNNWFYTEKKFTFTSPKGITTGQGVDFSKDFKVINSQRISGQIETSKNIN